MEALSGAGIPIYAEPGRNGGIYLMQEFIMDRAVLTDPEKQAILAAIQSVSATGYAYDHEMQTKLSAIFNVNTGDWLEVDLARWGKHSCDNSKFEVLKKAVIRHNMVKMVYENTNSIRSERIVEPLKLSYKAKEWYLKGFCLEKQDFRLFKLNRILELVLLEDTFVPRPYPETVENTQQEFPSLVLLFSKEIAYRVYDEFDDTQIQQQKNGDVIASANMPVDSWLIGYLLSFGTQVFVMEPAYLRKILAARAKENYEKNKS